MVEYIISQLYQALFEGDVDTISTRDIILETWCGDLQRINELHDTYLALQYPLLFPYGEDRYRHDILHKVTSLGPARKRMCLTIREWFSFKLQFRLAEAQTLLHSRKLFQEFVVDDYTMVESERLAFIRMNQSKLSVDKYSNLHHSSDVGATQGSNRVKRII